MRIDMATSGFQALRQRLRRASERTVDYHISHDLNAVAFDRASKFTAGCIQVEV